MAMSDKLRNVTPPPAAVVALSESSPLLGAKAAGAPLSSSPLPESLAPPAGTPPPLQQSRSPGTESRLSPGVDGSSPGSGSQSSDGFRGILSRVSAALCSGRGLLLAFYMTTSILLSVANTLSWKRLLNKFRSENGSDANYEFFVVQLTVFLYVLMAAVVLGYRMIATDLITPQQKRFPTSKFLAMGALDACSGVLGGIGGALTSGQLQTLIYQAAIPLTMIMSALTLRIKYTFVQYSGAALIVVGALFAGVTSAGSQSGQTTIIGLVVLIASLVPGSYSNVYKESNLKSEAMDVYYLTTYVSWWQVLIGFAFCPLLSMPGLGGLPLTEIPNNVRDGWRCFLGEPLDGFSCDRSPSPILLCIAYVVINFVYNSNIHASSSRLPAAAHAFSIDSVLHCGRVQLCCC
jgi:drug/metabolite transporter (DMT)-like permease